jgi:hypothetical protein
MSTTAVDPVWWRPRSTTHKRRPGALPVSGVYRRSGMADEVRLTALRSSSRSFWSIGGDEVSPDALTIRVRVSAQISFLYLILILILGQTLLSFSMLWGLEP